DLQVKINELFAKDNLSVITTGILNYVANGLIGLIGGLISGIVTLFTAIIFSIYILCQKEYLQNCGKKLLEAYVPRKRANKIKDVVKLSSDTFSKFISGQCLEAIILGLILFGALIFFKFPYALIISVLTSITALIPIFGAVIAMVVGAILIAIENPLQALMFMIVFQVVQQIEGNFIYPRVVGKSVGLSPMWTLLSITVGGSLFGVMGMLVGLPLASIMYALIRSDVNNRILKKKDEVKDTE
nr:AI-2E family transporter [Bacilli bacterium]